MGNEFNPPCPLLLQTLSAQFNLIEHLGPKTVRKPENYDVINIYGFYNIITDFVLLLMPMPEL